MYSYHHILIFLIIGSFSAGCAEQVQPINQIFWSETEKFVSSGTKYLDVEIDYKNPCIVLRGFIDEWQKDFTAINQGLWDTNESDTGNPSESDGGKLDLRKELKNSIDRCNQQFEKTSITAHRNRTMEISSGHPLEIQETRSLYLQDNFLSSLVEAEKAHALKLNLLEVIRSIRENSPENRPKSKIGKSDALAKENLETITDNLIERMKSKNKFLLADVVNSRLLAEIGEVHPNSLHLESLDASHHPSNHTKRLRALLSGETQDIQATVHKINAFLVYKSCGSRFNAKAYTGPTHVVRNNTIDCVRGADIGPESFTRLNCDIPNYKDARLVQFSDIWIDSHSELIEQYFTHDDRLFVYCWPNSFNITHNSNAQTMICPEHPFAINKSAHLLYNAAMDLGQVPENMEINLNVVNYHKPPISACPLTRSEFESMMAVHILNTCLTAVFVVIVIILCIQLYRNSVLQYNFATLSSGINYVRYSMGCKRSPNQGRLNSFGSELDILSSSMQNPTI